MVACGDSVLIPMRLRTEDNGAWQWSGSRNFYQSVREGVMSLDEEHPPTSGLNLSDGCFMIQRGESDAELFACQWPGTRCHSDALTSIQGFGLPVNVRVYWLERLMEV